MTPRQGLRAVRSPAPLTRRLLAESSAKRKEVVVGRISAIGHFGKYSRDGGYVQDAADEILAIIKRDVPIELFPRQLIRQLLNPCLRHDGLVLAQRLIYRQGGDGPRQ